MRITHNITDEIKKPIILIDSAIHAREWVSLSTNMWLIQEVTIIVSGGKGVAEFVTKIYRSEARISPHHIDESPNTTAFGTG